MRPFILRHTARPIQVERFFIMIFFYVAMPCVVYRSCAILPRVSFPKKLFNMQNQLPVEPTEDHLNVSYVAIQAYSAAF